MKAETYFDTQPQIDLANAISKGDTNEMHVLVANGADVNYLGREDMRPLFWALCKQNIVGFKFLLDCGAKPNVVAKYSRWESAINIAARMDDSEYLEQLLKHGGNPNSIVGDSPQSMRTVIFSAAYDDKTNNIAILLKYGADIDWTLPDGTTPLHDSIYSRSYEAALFLYHAGANPLVKDKLGYNTVDTMMRFKDNGVLSRADEKAYKQLLKEFRERGFVDKFSNKEQ